MRRSDSFLGESGVCLESIATFREVVPAHCVACRINTDSATIMASAGRFELQTAQF